MKNKTKTIKHLISSVFIVVIMLMVPVLSVSADTKEYQVDYAEFTADLQENGDAIITENWTVTYTSGSFTRFYKEILNPDNQLEYIKDIQVQSCQINGADAEPQFNTDRNDGHYFLEKGSDRFTIHWFQHAQNETVKYKITYLVPDAVRLNESDNAAFCYRFIGVNFPVSVSDVKAIIRMPVISDTISVTLSDGEFKVEDGVMICTTSNHSGIYKINIEMNDDRFSGLGRVIDVEIPEAVTRSGDGDDSEDVMIAVGGFSVIAVIFGLIYTGIKAPARKAKKTLKKDPNCLIDAAGRLERQTIPYPWYATLSNNIIFSKEHFILLYIELFELAKIGNVELGDNGIIIHNNYRSTNDSVQDEYNLAFLNLVTETFKNYDDGNVTSITYNTIKETLDDRHVLYDFYTKLNDWNEAYEKALKNSTLYGQLENSGAMEQIKADIKLWSKVGPYFNNKVSSLDCINLIKRTGKMRTQLLSLHNISVRPGQIIFIRQQLLKLLKLFKLLQLWRRRCRLISGSNKFHM